MMKTGKMGEYVQYIQKDLGPGGKQVFRSDIGTVFGLNDWQKALKLYSKGNARKLFFKICK